MRRVILKPYDKDRFELQEDYNFEGIIIPKGYKTNGANIPRIFWSLFPPNNPEYLTASIIHDYLCDVATEDMDIIIERNIRIDDSTSMTINSKDHQLLFLKEADKALRRAMIALGCNKRKAQLFYFSCRLYHIIRYDLLKRNK